jgi:hypothetical protein
MWHEDFREERDSSSGNPLTHIPIELPKNCRSSSYPRTLEYASEQVGRSDGVGFGGGLVGLWWEAWWALVGAGPCDRVIWKFSLVIGGWPTAGGPRADRGLYAGELAARFVFIRGIRRSDRRGRRCRGGAFRSPTGWPQSRPRHRECAGCPCSEHRRRERHASRSMRGMLPVHRDADGGMSVLNTS